MKVPGLQLLRVDVPAADLAQLREWAKGEGSIAWTIGGLIELRRRLTTIGAEHLRHRIPDLRDPHVYDDFQLLNEALNALPELLDSYAAKPQPGKPKRAAKRARKASRKSGSKQ